MPFENRRSDPKSYERNSQKQLSKIIDNYNFVSPVGFRLIIDKYKYPNTQFVIQRVNLPQMGVSMYQVESPKIPFHVEGTKMEFSTLDISFLIDENFVNYREMYDWLYDQVNVQESKEVSKKRDMTLQVLSSHNNISTEFFFSSAFPTSLSGASFDSSSSDVTYIEANVTFQYDYFTIK
jgi:hypothetical protein